MLEFRVLGQKMEVLNPKYIVQGSSNYLKARFFLDESWEDYSVIANFSNYNNETILPVSIILDDKSTCDIPNEVCNANTIYVSLIGTKEDVTVTTNVVLVNQIPSGQLQKASSLENVNILSKFIYDVNVSKEEDVVTFTFSTISGTFTKTINVSDSVSGDVVAKVTDVNIQDNKLVVSFSDSASKDIDLSELANTGLVTEEKVNELIATAIKDLSSVDTSDFLTKEKILEDEEIKEALKGETGDKGETGEKGADADLTEVEAKISQLESEIATLKSVIENLQGESISQMSLDIEEEVAVVDYERNYQGAVNSVSDLPAIGIKGYFYDVLSESCQYEWVETTEKVGWVKIVE